MLSPPYTEFHSISSAEITVQFSTLVCRLVQGIKAGGLRSELLACWRGAQALDSAKPTHYANKGVTPPSQEAVK